jgi:hypothetical protein
MSPNLQPQVNTRSGMRTALIAGAVAGQRAVQRAPWPVRALDATCVALPACQLPTGSSPCTSLSANSSIMLPPSLISTSAARSAVPNGITKSDSRECAGHAPVISAAVCAGVHRVLVNQSMASPRIRLT